MNWNAKLHYCLPAASLLKKGENYYYHRIIQNQKHIETYIDFDQVEELRAQIRKELEAELKKIGRLIPSQERMIEEKATHQFSTYVRIGPQLKSLAAPVKKYKRRECYSVLHDFVFGEQQDKVFILYGLRRTGRPH